MADRKDEGGSVERLEREARLLEEEAHRLEDVAREMEERAHHLEEEAHRIEEGAGHPHSPGDGGEDDHGGEHDHGGGHDHGGKDIVCITVVVNGEPTRIDARLGDRLGKIREEALEQTNNIGQPAEKWELKDASGALLDIDRTVGSYHFAAEVTLFLSLEAGVAGV